MGAARRRPGARSRGRARPSPGGSTIELLPREGLKAVWFGRHVYQPLLYLQPGSKLVEIRPAPLNKGEYQFVQDLQDYCESHLEEFENRELYLLRNLSRGRGVGFFEAENFHPDFILWLVTASKQHVLFVDPKGIRHLEPDHDKIRFHATIKEIEARLGDASIQLESFILSNTASHDMRRLWKIEKSDMEERHILFQDEDRDRYVGAMLAAAGWPD